MEEIKFRAWDKVTKVMYNSAIYNCKDSFDMILKHPQIYDVMQYTGLKDKNGVEIYEGDIVITPRKHLCEVCFIDGAFLLRILNTKCTEYYIHDFIKFNKTEIKGNIYENPELLGSD